MKVKKQKYPRLYIGIHNKESFCKLDYYDNQYDNDGNFKLNSTLIPSEKLINTDSDKKKLYDLNKIEFQILNNLIKKQQKVVEIYLNKNKKEQYRVVNSSLELLFEYQKIFLEWFSNNRVL